MCLLLSKHSILSSEGSRPAAPGRGWRRVRPATAGGAGWAIAITSVALFMATLDNLVVTTALPVIRVHLHAGLAGLEWTVNAYTLTFAVLLLTGAVLGDRFGRRRIFLAGLALFTGASAAAALSPSIGWLVAARTVQGAGGALLMPLSLTLLSAAVAPERRNMALGLWGAVGGLAVAAGPLIGGAVTTGWAWQYIFWINVPVGIVLIALATRRLRESHGPRKPLDLLGVLLLTAGLFGVVLGLVRGDAHGWSSGGVLAAFAVGAAAIASFLAWERRSLHPMLPLGLFRRRAFTTVNVLALAMSFGMFGSIFFLAQFLQFVQHETPLAAGLRVLPWTAMPMLVAPLAGALAQRLGGRPLLFAGLSLQAAGLAWLAAITATGVAYADLWLPFVISGVGMALFFVPLASVVLAAVSTDHEGLASGTNNTFREVGGVLGIAALGAVFTSHGGYTSGHAYVAGLRPALWVAVAVLGAGALFTVLLPRGIAAGRAQAAADPRAGHQAAAGRRAESRPHVAASRCGVRAPTSSGASPARAVTHR